MSNTSPSYSLHSLWNTSGEHHITLGNLSVNHSNPAEISYADLRVWLNYDTDGDSLIDTAFRQMETLCTEECLECEGPDSCAVCKEGFYRNAGECLNCFYSCKSCFGGTKNSCNSCVGDFLFNPDFSCKMTCPLGYFSGENQICERCPSECATCLNTKECISCTQGLFQFNHQCLQSCPTGTWLDSSKCSLCHLNCEGCNGPSNSDCVECKSPYVKVEGYCTQCEKKHFYDAGVCRPCDPSCAECESLVSCTACIEGLTLLNSGECYECLAGPSCFNCEPLCSACSLEGCTDCLAGSVLVKGKCECMSGTFNEGGACCISYTVKTSDNSHIQVKFSSALTPTLIAQQVLLKLDVEAPLIRVIETDSLSDYSMILDWSSSLNQEVQANVSILDLNSSHPICSAETQLTFNLTKTESKELGIEKGIISTITWVVCGSLMIVTSFSGNPSIFISMLNSLQLLSLIPLMDVSLDDKTTALLIGVDIFSFIPNTTELFLSTDFFDLPYKKAKHYGYISAGFLYNSGQEITIIVLLCIWKVVQLFLYTVLPCSRSVLTQTFNQIKFGTFAFYFKSCFIELILAAMIQIRSTSIDNWVEGLSLFLMLSWLVFCVLMLVIFFKGRKTTYDKANAFFESYKLSQASRFHVLLNFAYQAIFVIIITLTNDARVQLTVCSILSSAVRTP